MIQSVFVLLSSQDNACIFYGQIDENDEVDDLGNILGVVAEYSSRLKDGQIKNIRISQGKFAYGKFNKIFLVFKIQQSDDMEEIKLILEKMAKGFMGLYSGEIESDNADADAYSGFTDKINDFLTLETPSAPAAPRPALNIKPVKEETAPSAEPSIVEPEKSGKELLKTPNPIGFTPREIPTTEASEDKPLIPPQKRDAYANGIEDYMIDEVMWNESQAVMKEYTADFVDGVIAKIKLFLSISIVHHYEIIIDFQDYPKKAKLLPSSEYDQPVIDKIEKISYFLRNWDVRIPPHIIEIAREIEKILTMLKSKGELDQTNEMPNTMMPELEPLEKLPPLPQKAKSNSNISEPDANVKESEELIPPKVEDTKQSPTNSAPKVSPSAELKAIEQKQTDTTKKSHGKDSKKSAKEKEKERKRREKEQRRLLKKEKKEDQKRLKEVMKEADEDAKNEGKF